MSVIPDLIWNPEVPFLFELIWIPAGVYPHRGTGMTDRENFRPVRYSLLYSKNIEIV